MQFRIADTFTDSLSKLTNQEQKVVKTTVFDLQVDPAQPGMQLHKLDRTKDPHFWSVRVNRDIRIIVHKTAANLLLCYVDHHDDAYDWAGRRKIETHPKTGAAQLIEVRERIEEIPVYPAVQAPSPIQSPVQYPAPSGNQAALFRDYGDEILLGFGIPREWLPDVRLATEDTLFEVAEHLPQEAAEALLDLAVGVQPAEKPPAPVSGDPFAHPDALRRFRLFDNLDELVQALEYPWEKWTVFLHPMQRTLVEKTYNGPARIAGSAGTGKTIVALHRAVHLARRNKHARILLTTFSQTLAQSLREKLVRLASKEPRVVERIEVETLAETGRRLYRARFGAPKIASNAEIEAIMTECAGRMAFSRTYSNAFLLNEWLDIIDAWQLNDEASYQDIVRLGRKTRLSAKQRQELWALFAAVRSVMEERGLLTEPALLGRVTAALAEDGPPPYDYAIVDEAQDISVPALRFLAALGRDNPQALFFTGDLGQRIFQTPFSWKALGVDIRGRSHTLRINYRTSHQIRSRADTLLPPAVTDVDGNTENRDRAVSVFNGPDPVMTIADDCSHECELVASWINARRAEGYQPNEIGIIVRSESVVDRAIAATQAAGMPFRRLPARTPTDDAGVTLATMHQAKGLEFRAVVVMACDEEILPLQERVEAVSDESDLKEVYDTERRLLYVACTRARDQLLVIGADPGSEFLDDFYH